MAGRLSLKAALAWFEAHQYGWRWFLIGIIPTTIACLFALANSSPLLRLPDRFFYDLVTLSEPGMAPRVVIVEDAPRDASGAAALAKAALQRGVARVAFPVDPGIDAASGGISVNRLVIGRSVAREPGFSWWRFTGPLRSPGVSQGGAVLAKADYGLRRFQLAWLEGRKGRIETFEAAAAGLEVSPRHFLVRQSRNQNLPRIKAAQILDGELGRDSLAGKVALIEPPQGYWTAVTATARDAGSRPVSRLEFSAAAI